MTLLLELLDVFDLLDRLAVIHAVRAVIPVLRLGHGSGDGETEYKTQSLHLDEVLVLERGRVVLQCLK